MDPVVLLGSVGKASKLLSAVSATLYKIIQDTKPVNKTVEALFREIVSLQGSMDAIGSVLQQPFTQAIIQDDEHCDLWKSVNGCLLECRKSVERLEKLIVDKKSRNPFKKVVMQNEINWKSEEYVTLRQQIHSHGLAMQLALQAINVYVSSKAPETAIGSLSPKIDVLINMIAAIDMNWSPQENDQRHQMAGTETISPADEKLREFASKIASSVSAIVTSRSTPQRGSARDSTRGSIVRGVSLKPDNRSEIKKLNRRTSSIAAPSVNQPRPEKAVARERHETYSESPVAITEEVVKNLVHIAEKNLERAYDHFDAYRIAKRKFLEDESKITKQRSNRDDGLSDKHYVTRDGQRWRLYYWEEKAGVENLAKAERGFLQALREGKKTGTRSFNSDCNIQFQLARIYRCQARWNEHDRILNSLLDRRYRISAEANALLADSFLHRNRLDEADEFCRRALKNPSGKVLEDDPGYRRTMELAIRICKARGEDELAEAYEAQLPVARSLGKPAIKSARKSAGDEFISWFRKHEKQ